jgi:hypothetical protein
MRRDNLIALLSRGDVVVALVVLALVALVALQLD